MIDTSAAIKFLNETLPQKGREFMHFAIQSGPVVSFITEIELLS